MPYPSDADIIGFFTGPFDTSTTSPLVKANKVAIPDGYSGILSTAGQLEDCLAVLDSLGAGSGWTPTLAVATDGNRLVLEVTGWTGGTGTAPGTGYVGAAGLESDIADGVNIRGAQGVVGPQGIRGEDGTLWTIGAVFPGSPADGDLHLFNANATGLSSYVDASDNPITTAVNGDYAAYDLANTRWAYRGTLIGPLGTFLSHNDTPAAFGTSGMALVANATGDALVFGGPFQPLDAPAAPSNVRATDAFDGSLEMRFNSVTGATMYEWQSKANGQPWPGLPGTMITGTTVGQTNLALGNYDFRVRAVGSGGLLQSAWSQVLNIPIIATPTPGTSTSNSLTRAGNRRLRFDWQTLDVNNGGSGSGRVVKSARYEYQIREVGGPMARLYFQCLIVRNEHIEPDKRPAL